jgi:hypothetical protein
MTAVSCTVQGEATTQSMVLLVMVVCCVKKSRYAACRTAVKLSCDQGRNQFCILRYLYVQHLYFTVVPTLAATSLTGALAFCTR